MTKKKIQTPEKQTYVAILLDRSGSMSGLRNEVPKLYRQTIQSLRDVSQGEKTNVSLFLFDGSVETKFVNVPLENVPNDVNYTIGGSTALLDAVEKSIDLMKFDESPKSQNAGLVITITDGQDTDRPPHLYGSFAALISKKQGTDKWTFTFKVPGQYHKNDLVRKFGIPEGNVDIWTQTSQGVQETTQHITRGLTSYYGARSAGATSVNSFYVQPDLSQVNTKLLNQELDDLSSKFTLHDVPKESIIKDFVEQKTKEPYSLGRAFYKLQKTESIQAQKQILIMDIKTKKIWGGDEARDLIGLPRNQKAKVVPGNHGNYEIFAQSTSVNRKLPRGTKILIKK